MAFCCANCFKINNKFRIFAYMKKITTVTLAIVIFGGFFALVFPQNICDKFPDLMRVIELKELEQIAGDEYLNIFTKTQEYRPAVLLPGMIDDRVASSLKVYPVSANKAPLLQYSFKIMDQTQSSDKTLEKYKEYFMTCGLKEWTAKKEVDESFGDVFIHFTKGGKKEKITFSTSIVFLDGFTRTQVFVIQIELNGWEQPDG